MTRLRAVFLLLFLAVMVTLNGGIQFGQTSAQASTPITENLSARDAATSRADIALTNSCIEAGQTKDYCLCVTKVLKYQMSLREYMAAVKLYPNGFNSDPTARSALKISLRQSGYNDQEITNIENFQSQLLERTNLKQQCEMASAYYDPLL